jgi:hypothetical protein
MVYAVTLRGSSQRLAYTLMPVKELIAAAPPIKIEETTRMFEAKLKNMKEKCATVPYRTRIISRNVRALGAFLLDCLKRSASKKTNPLDRQTYNSQVAKNHDLRTITGSVKEGSRNTILVGNSA